MCGFIYFKQYFFIDLDRHYNTRTKQKKEDI